MIRTTSTAILAVLLVVFGLGLLGSTPDRVSQTSAVSAAPPPTATYVSELGSAVVQAPREPAALPATGAVSPTAPPWPKAAGLGLALIGSLLIHAAIRLRPAATG